MTPTTPVLAAGVGGLTFAWYALPDAVRSRAVRTALKSGIVAASVAAMPLILPRDTDAPLVLPEDGPSPALVAGGLAALAGGVALSVWGEKAIFAFGERRRARGVRFAHALPAAGLAVLAAAVMALDPPWAPEADR